MKKQTHKRNSSASHSKIVKDFKEGKPEKMEEVFAKVTNFKFHKESGALNHLTAKELKNYFIYTKIALNSSQSYYDLGHASYST